ncbi:MAG: NADH-quinone oxidoreductase subunit NuoB [Gemmatimonadota bacterium]|nr:MAG: NADH-quinone oxidoreductase subunit NuoB [Gemmatimonadota bacterium]
MTTKLPPWWITKIDWVVNWARRGSLWMMPFNTACCGIEFMAAAASKYDIARFGMERLGYTPRQADLLIVGGRVPYKIAPVLRRIWDQMPQPKWCIAMGACASTGGIFDTYTIMQGVDAIVPVDAYVPGCPPRPEGLIYAILMIHQKIRGESLTDPTLRTELSAIPGQLNMSPEMIEQQAQPFGNSTQQDRISGLEPTAVTLRPRDRRALRLGLRRAVPEERLDNTEEPCHEKEDPGGQ